MDRPHIDRSGMALDSRLPEEKPDLEQGSFLEAVHNRSPKILKALGQLLRGITLIFWALPMGLLVLSLTLIRGLGGEPTPLIALMRSLNVVPALLFTGMLAVGVLRLRRFMREQSRGLRTLEVTQTLAWINVGLSPFLFWWSRKPDILHFQLMAALLTGGCILFLAFLNRTLQQLSLRLPDPVIREETHLIGRLNQLILGVLICLAALWFFMNQGTQGPEVVEVSNRLTWLFMRLGNILMILLLVVPVATTMAVLWKIRELILVSIFHIDT